MVEQSPSPIAAVHDLGDVMLGVVLLALGPDRAHLVLVQLHEELPAGAGGRNLGVVVHAVDGELDELAALAVLELVGVAQEMGAQRTRLLVFAKSRKCSKVYQNYVGLCQSFRDILSAL